MKDIRATFGQIAEDAAIHAAIQPQTVAEPPIQTRKHYGMLPGCAAQAPSNYTFAAKDSQQADCALVDLEANSTQLPIRDDGIRSAPKPSAFARAVPEPAGTGLGASRCANQPCQADSYQQETATISSCKAITFGIECEHVFAFREDELVRVTQERKIPYLRIQKIHSIRENKILLLYGREWGWTVCPSRRRQSYPSWTIVQNVADAACSEVPDNLPRFRSSESCGKEGCRHDFIRTIYTTEPFFIAKRVLAHHNLDVDICAWVIHPASDEEPARLEGSETDFKAAKLLGDNAWTLTRDASVMSLLKRQLSERSSVIPEEEVDMWDSHGVELVSPIFKLTLDGKREACPDPGLEERSQLRHARKYMGRIARSCRT